MPFPTNVEASAAQQQDTAAQGSTVRATDPGSLFAQTGIDFTIFGAPPVTGFDTRPPNWPNVYSMGAVNSWKDRVQIAPEKTYMEIAVMVAWQDRGIYSASQRLETYGIWNTMRGVNPDLRVINHQQNWQFEVNGASFTSKDGHVFQRAIYQNGQWGWIFNTFNTIDEPYIKATSSSVQAQKWAVNIGLDAVREYIVDTKVDLMADIAGGGASNLFSLGGFYFGHDSAPPQVFKKFGTSRHKGVIGTPPGYNTNPQTDLFLDTPWPNAPVTGSADGNGFFNLSEVHDLIIFSKKTVPDGARALEILKYKVTDTRGEVQLKTQNDLSNQVFFETDQDKFIITLRDGNTSNADWSDPSDGVINSGNIGSNDGLPLRRNALIDQFDKWDTKVFNEQGFNSPRWHNGLSTGATRKRNAGNPVPWIYDNTWDLTRWESVSGAIRFEDDGINITSRSDSVDRLMRGIGLGETWLRNISVVPPGGLNGILVNAQVINTYAGWKADLSQIAFIRFWAAFCMVRGICIPNFEILGADNGSHDTPLIDEQMIYLGDFPARQLAANMGTHDIAGGGNGTAGYPVGAHTFDGVPDWGTRGFWAEYSNTLVLCDLHTPSLDPWVPTHLPSGQTGQMVTLPDAGAGMDWYYFDPTSYVNPQTGLDINNAALTAAFVGRDTALNSGVKVTANQVEMGPLQGLFLQRGVA